MVVALAALLFLSNTHAGTCPQLKAEFVRTQKTEVDGRLRHLASFHISAFTSGRATFPVSAGLSEMVVLPDHAELLRKRDGEDIWKPYFNDLSHYIPTNTWIAVAKGGHLIAYMGVDELFQDHVSPKDSFRVRFTSEERCSENGVRDRFQQAFGSSWDDARGEPAYGARAWLRFVFGIFCSPAPFAVASSFGSRRVALGISQSRTERGKPHAIVCQRRRVPGIADADVLDRRTRLGHCNDGLTMDIRLASRLSLRVPDLARCSDSRPGHIPRYLRDRICSVPLIGFRCVDNAH